MPWNVDARVPVLLAALDQVGADDALLLEGDDGADRPAAARFDLDPAGHQPGCTCCAPHNPAALALNRLFQARARGETPFFRRVVAVTRTPEGDLAVWAALRSDPLTAGRFRPAE